MKTKKIGKNNKLAKLQFDADNQAYFESIRNKPILHLPVLNLGDFDSPTTNSKDGKEDNISLSPSSAVIMWIFEQYKLYELIDIQLLVPESIHPSSNGKKKAEVIYVPTDSAFKDWLRSCEKSYSTRSQGQGADMVHIYPFIRLTEKRLTIVGICSVIRFMIKYAHIKLGSLKCTTEYEKLMGFRQTSLQACAGVSVWTKFCEIEIFEDLETILEEVAETREESKLDLPVTAFRFEYHMEIPVKMHNIQKAEKTLKLDKLALHQYAEGPEMRLSDLVLFPCISIFHSIFGQEVFEKHFPKTLIWLSKLEERFQLQTKLRVHSCTGEALVSCWNVPSVPRGSLYESDGTRDNMKVLTKQEDIEEAFDFLRSANISPMDISGVSTSLDWGEIPKLVHPEAGQLPHSRRERKCEQLSCMAIEVMKVVKEKERQSNFSSPLRIVDFCSGGGHLGILLAWLMRDGEREIILVENKEDSLRRAWERVERLGLTNVALYQCNLDYFDSHFDVGTSLHACGTATDLVLRKCIAAKASFVFSPCCYGKIGSNHVVDYPRSLLFQESGLQTKLYFIVAHASDQTHDEKNKKTQQGRDCMRIIDTDRALGAIEQGYQVCLKRMVPDTASPKNHILVGVTHSSIGNS